MKQKSPIKQRILEYINYNGLSKYEFYKITGITRGVLDQENGITEANILKFITIYKEVSIPWLILGEGAMLQSGDTSIKSSDNVANKDIPLDLPSQKSIGINPKTFSIPLIPIETLPAYLTSPKTDISTSYYQSNFLDTLFSDADFYTRVRDLSLFPLYNSGDLIACKRIQPEDFIQWNKIYLLATSQGTIIKRVLQGKDEHHLKMGSDNPSFHAFEIDRGEIKAMAIVRGGIHME